MHICLMCNFAKTKIVEPKTVEEKLLLSAGGMVMVSFTGFGHMAGYVES